ncbi:MAG: hypothetical protein ABJA67_10705 [Chthonomonadales bacterium]
MSTDPAIVLTTVVYERANGKEYTGRLLSMTTNSKTNLTTFTYDMPPKPKADKVERNDQEIPSRTTTYTYYWENGNLNLKQIDET